MQGRQPWKNKIPLDLVGRATSGQEWLKARDIKLELNMARTERPMET